MSRILKRPMFRKGGEVMEGIMTGIKPRQNYESGALAKSQNYKNILRAATQGASTGPDALTQFLLRTGQNLIGGQSAGGTKLQEIVGSTNEPMENYFKDLQRKAQQEKQIGLQAAMLGIKGQQGIDLAKAKAKEKYLKDESPERYYNNLVKDRSNALAKLKSFEKPTADLKFNRNVSEYDAFILPKLRKTEDEAGKDIQARYKGLLPFDIKSGTVVYDNLPAGVVFFDPEQKIFVERVPNEKGIDEYFSYNPYTYTKQKVDFGVKS
jgi:hypothetical protein